METILQETGGTGVDCILETLESSETSKFGKHELVSSLAACGRWATTHKNLQLDPPHSNLLFLKGASLCFLFPHIWLLSSSQLGRYQRQSHPLVLWLFCGCWTQLVLSIADILAELTAKFGSGHLVLKITIKEFPLDEAPHALTFLGAYPHQKCIILVSNE